MFQNAPGLTLMRPIYRRRMNLHPSNSGIKTKFRGGLVTLVVPSPSAYRTAKNLLIIIVVVVIHMSMAMAIMIVLVPVTTTTYP